MSYAFCLKLVAGRSASARRRTICRTSEEQVCRCLAATVKADVFRIEGGISLDVLFGARGFWKTLLISAFVSDHVSLYNVVSVVVVLAITTAVLIQDHVAIAGQVRGHARHSVFQDLLAEAQALCFTESLSTCHWCLVPLVGLPSFSLAMKSRS